eukprot:g3215.t1
MINEFVEACGEKSFSKVRYTHSQLRKTAWHVNSYHTVTGRTALHEACAHGLERNFRFLLQEGASVDQRTILGRQYPLHIAAANGNDALVRLLLRSEDVDAKCVDSHGRTALHVAATAGVSQTLIEHNFMLIFSLDKSAQTPMTFIRKKVANLQNDLQYHRSKMDLYQNDTGSYVEEETKHKMLEEYQKSIDDLLGVIATIEERVTVMRRAEATRKKDIEERRRANVQKKMQEQEEKAKARWKVMLLTIQHDVF